MRLRITRREAAGKSATEHTEAVRLMRTVRAHEGLHPELVWFHHIPNGGKRHRTVAGKLKAEGVKKGVHDYFLPVARQGFHGLYIELKSLDGDESSDQERFAAFVREQGYRAEFVWGWEAAWAVIADYLGIPNRLQPSGLVVAPAHAPSPTLRRPRAAPKSR